VAYAFGQSGLGRVKCFLIAVVLAAAIVAGVLVTRARTPACRFEVPGVGLTIPLAL